MKKLWSLAALVTLLTTTLGLADNSSPERLAPEKVRPALADSERIQGTWVVTSAELDGTVMEMFPVKLTIQDGRYFRRSTDPRLDGQGGQYTLDEDQWPNRATLTWIEDDEVFRRPGDFPIQQKSVILYELNGDTLRVCLRSDKSAPKQFTSKGQVIFTLIRQEKLEQKMHKK